MSEIKIEYRDNMKLPDVADFLKIAREAVNTSREIADKNGLTLGELKEITEKIARRNFCEGVENSGLPDGQP